MCYYFLMDEAARIPEIESENAKLKLRIQELEVLVAKLEALNAYYIEQFRLAQHRRFGASSEQTDTDGNIQLALAGVFNEAEDEANKSIPEPQVEEITYKRKKSTGKREKDLSGLPVERVEYELPEEQRICQGCGKPILIDIGVTVQRELIVIPAKVVVRENAVHAYKQTDGCDCDHAVEHAEVVEVQTVEEVTTEAVAVQVVEGIATEAIAVQTVEEIATEALKVQVVEEIATEAVEVQITTKAEDTLDYTPAIIIRAEAPVPLISGSLASPSAVAYIVNQKYFNGLPLYRIERELQNNGVNLSRQTMANWIIYCAENYLNAMYLLLIAILLGKLAIHGDETTHQVLHEPGKAATSKSYEWIYRTSGYDEHPIVIYQYRRSRGSEHPKEFLKDFVGFLHTDGYQAYHDLPGIITVGCWQHARSYFVDLYKTLPKDTRDDSNAARGIAFIDKLFIFEREFAELSPKERYEKRLEKSKPVAEAFFVWAASLGALPKSLLGKAVHYALSQREYLMNVFLDGHLEMSNNRAERSVKIFVMGRKAWLFSNTPNGADASSIMFSIVATAWENGLKPYEYVKFLLEKLPTAKTSELEKYLPWSESIPDYCRVPVKPGQEKQNESGTA